MLIHSANVIVKVSHFVKVLKQLETLPMHLLLPRNYLRGMLIVSVLAAMSSCQSSIRFSSRSSVKEVEHIPSQQHSSKSRANSSNSTAKKPSFPPENLTSTQERLLVTAEHWLGTPYRYGAATRAGTDCSGFAMRLFEEAGVGKLPRSTKDQWTIGSSIDRQELRTGDLLFFNTNGIGVSHVGVYAGQDSVFHASSTYGVVKQSFSETYLTRAFMGARRVLSLQKE
ncbi:MAG: hypothetical protein EAZ92_09880 [Candidatus Kapaibacterium sp.]|nr:MAG: hypothetical protein EAZ92_09880 [Candidatus Kapabacteria bacterium]